MNIDKRLRAAQKQQLYQVQAEVRRRGLEQPPQPQPRWPWFLSLAMAAAVLVFVWQVAPRATTDAVGSADSPSSTTATTNTSTTKSPSTTSPATTSPNTSASNSRQAGTNSTAAPPTATGPQVVAAGDLDAAVASGVCASGYRAQLERAALRYVSRDRGWNRMADLVNEQGGPFYFGLWEPDYDGTVSVEVRLDAPANVTEIQLAQHPYQDVSGTITIETGDLVIPIELSGRDGFKTHTFTEPTPVESFVITRTEPESNITEIFLCVESP